MNRAIFESMLKKKPGSLKSRYIFVNDVRAICEAIVTVGYASLYVSSSKSDAFFDAESLVEYIRDKMNTGSSLPEYIFILGCYRKKTNDRIESVLKSNLIEYKVGAYTLFKDKEYLGNYDRQDELEKLLADYIQRYEGPDEVTVDKEQFIRRDPDGREKGIMEKALVDYIIETVSFFVVGGIPYVYHHGVFTEDPAGIELKAVIQSLLYDRYVNYRTIGGVYRLLLDQKPVQRQFEELNAYPSHWINFANGFFDVKQQKMYRHDPKYMAINQIPHELDLSIRDDMETAGWETMAFLDYAVPDKADQEMLFEYIGYCMTRDTCFQKFLIIKGTGGTGKSSIITVIQHIVGMDNVSGISMQDMSQRFYPSQLRGKLLNACADISADSLNSVDVIKKATGEDVLMYERKGVDASTFRSYAKLMFSANQIPLNLDEKSDALYRRMLILVMDKKPRKIDLELDEKLKRECGFLIWMGIAGLQRLYREGQFRESAGSRTEVEKLHRAADTVKAFMDEQTVREQGSDIKRSLLYDQYVEYCKGYGRKPHGANSFYRNLEDKGYELKHRSTGDYVLGVVLKGEDFTAIDRQDKSVPFGESDKRVIGK